MLDLVSDVGRRETGAISLNAPASLQISRMSVLYTNSNCVCEHVEMTTPHDDDVKTRRLPIGSGIHSEFPLYLSCSMGRDHASFYILYCRISYSS